MLVPMIPVGGVPASTMNVVDVVAVRTAGLGSGQVVVIKSPPVVGHGVVGTGRRPRRLA